MALEKKEFILIIICHTPPEQNGKAERYNRNLPDKGKTTITDANKPKHFLHKAIRVATYVLNISSSSDLNVTPAEIWNGFKSDIKL